MPRVDVDLGQIGAISALRFGKRRVGRATGEVVFALDEQDRHVKETFVFGFLREVCLYHSY